LERLHGARLAFPARVGQCPFVIFVHFPASEEGENKLTRKWPLRIWGSRRKPHFPFSLKSLIITFNHNLTVDASVNVALGVEEDLSVANVVLLALADVGSHQIVEILLDLEDLAAFVV